MLGRYENFPTEIEGFARFTYPASIQALQLAIVKALHQLNKEAKDLKKLTKASPTNCTVNFEFGIAEADAFNFLDEEELKRMEKTLKKQVLPVLDVFCVARYHTEQAEGKRKSLKFDYGILRFAFGRKNSMELFVYHERGTQRIPLEDLVVFMQDQINKRLTEKGKKTLILKNVVKSQLMFGPKKP